MTIFTILALAFGLAMDAFAVAISAGIVLPELSFRRIFRLSWHFGLFQFLMPVLGWLAGLTIQDFVSSFAAWIAFGLLGWVGGKMIYESCRPVPDHDPAAFRDPTRGFSLVVLSIATSIDALAVGMSLAMVDITIWFASIVIGITAGIMTIIGMFVGKKLGALFGRRMELIGGLILIGIGLKILARQLTGA